MATGERFYLLDLHHRPALEGDLGSVLRVEGIVIGGEGAQAVFMLPSAEFTAKDSYRLSLEQWVEFLRRADDPDILVGPAKAFHRKCRFEISGAVQQKVWFADGLKCMYCGGKMPYGQLTIDHWEPLENGGKNDTSNFIAACRRCNKDKGSMPAKDWCNLKGLDYDYFVEYLKTRKV